MHIGYAKIRGNKIYFDDKGRKLILEHAKKKHLSPKRIVMDALKRGFKRYAKEIQGKR